MARRPLVAGNWKMHGDRAMVADLLSALKSGYQSSWDSKIDVGVFPPFVFLADCMSALSGSNIILGAQTAASADSGAYTGAVSAAMCREFGCQSVIVGHSERRHVFLESDQMVAQQVQQVLAAGLQPILCVGETLEQREAGDTLAVVQRQLAAVTSLADNRAGLEKLTLAYEPVWAIGTGKRAMPEDIVAVHTCLRTALAEVDATKAETVRILYGGSVKPDNAAELFGLANVDGALVGGASLDADKFLEIIALCFKSF